MKRIYIAAVIFLIFVLAVAAVWFYYPRTEEKGGLETGVFCRMTGGTFVDGECTCPSVRHLEAPLIYNEETGFCETRPGVPYFDDGAALSV